MHPDGECEVYILDDNVFLETCCIDDKSFLVVVYTGLISLLVNCFFSFISLCYSLNDYTSDFQWVLY